MYMLIAASHTGLDLSFDVALIVVLALNLIIFFTLTFAPGFHNRLTEWFLNNISHIIPKSRD